MNHLDQLAWRYATKRMTGEKIAEESLNRILKAVALAPSSMGLQPYNVLVIESDEAKEKLAKACQQPQIKESSCVLVFCNWTAFSEAKVDAYMQNIAATRQQDVANLTDFKNRIMGFAGGMPQEQFNNWAAHQVYIALGFGVYAAALENVDATPMEGFAPPVLDEVFGLKAQGLHSVALLALGKRNVEADFLARAPKVRRSEEEHFTRL